MFQMVPRFVVRVLPGFSNSQSWKLVSTIDCRLRGPSQPPFEALLKLSIPIVTPPVFEPPLKRTKEKETL